MINPADNRYVHIYLTDHWTAAAGGVALARRICRENRSSPWLDRLQDVANEIAADDRTLSSVRLALGDRRGQWRRSLARAMEFMSRLKLNGRVVGYSPLSRVVESEGLLSGIFAKQRLWSALDIANLRVLDGNDFKDLIKRAERQLETVEEFHQWAVTEAFGSPGKHPPSVSSDCQ